MGMTGTHVVSSGEDAPEVADGGLKRPFPGVESGSQVVEGLVFGIELGLRLLDELAVVFVLRPVAGLMIALAVEDHSAASTAQQVFLALANAALIAWQWLEQHSPGGLLPWGLEVLDVALRHGDFGWLTSGLGEKQSVRPDVSLFVEAVVAAAVKAPVRFAGSCTNPFLRSYGHSVTNAFRCAKATTTCEDINRNPTMYITYS